MTWRGQTSEDLQKSCSIMVSFSSPDPGLGSASLTLVWTS
jgi:hypothetical protein